MGIKTNHAEILSDNQTSLMAGFNDTDRHHGIARKKSFSSLVEQFCSTVKSNALFVPT